MEKLAHDTYTALDRDPSTCGMFFLALKKPRILYTLWKTAHGHPEQSKMVKFLANDFNIPRWKTAASKNAFALLGKGRHCDAITFFLHGEQAWEMRHSCAWTNLMISSLPAALCHRCHGGDSGPVLDRLLTRKIIPHCVKTHDRWLFSLLMTLPITSLG